jgi:predicted dehydrogenase
MTGRWSVGILGAGRIAQAFDSPGSERVLTLAHAAVDSDRFALRGFFDIDGRRAEAAELTWRCGPSPRERAAWLAHGWDVICIATPDDAHARDLADALAARPRAILLEKPVAVDPRIGRELLAQARGARVPVVVDYPRRWHTGTAAVAELLAAGALGLPRELVVAYSGDTANSAVHAIDLFHALLGGGWKATRAGGSRQTALVTLRRGETEVAATFGRSAVETYYLWEVHLYCDRGKVELSRSPEVLSVWQPALHPTYRTHEVLSPLASYDMEVEPLLGRTFDRIAALIDDPAAARRHADREIESQELVAAVLEAIG